VPRSEFQALYRFLQFCNAYPLIHEIKTIGGLPNGTITILTDSKIVYEAMNTQNRTIKHTLIGEFTQQCYEELDSATAKGWTITIQKVKAHTDEDDIAQGRISKFDRVGNDIADHWAGHGAMLHQLSEQAINILNTIDATAWSIQRRLIAICQEYLTHDKYVKKERKAPSSPLDNDITNHGHAIDASHPSIICCSACGQTWKKATKRSMLHPCPGPAIWGLPPITPQAPWRPCPTITHLGKKLHHTHRLAWKRGVFYCVNCGGYSINRVGALVKECRMKCSARNSQALTDINNDICPSHIGHWPRPADATPPSTALLALAHRQGALNPYYQHDPPSQRDA
jgi:hypothetical protein